MFITPAISGRRSNAISFLLSPGNPRLPVAVVCPVSEGIVCIPVSSGGDVGSIVFAAAAGCAAGCAPTISLTAAKSGPNEPANFVSLGAKSCLVMGWFRCAILFTASKAGVQVCSPSGV